MNNDMPGIPAGMSWRDYAECRGLDHNMFFPNRGESTKAARAVCDSCYVVDECLEDAIARREIAGIRGSKSTRERQQIIKELGGAKKAREKYLPET